MACFMSNYTIVLILNEWGAIKQHMLQWIYPSALLLLLLLLLPNTNTAICLYKLTKIKEEIQFISTEFKWLLVFMIVRFNLNHFTKIGMCVCMSCFRLCEKKNSKSQTRWNYLYKRHIKSLLNEYDLFSESGINVIKKGLIIINAREREKDGKRKHTPAQLDSCLN